DIFGRLPLRHLPPDEAVAHGAAVQAALKSQDAALDDMVVTDVAPFSMGVAVVERLGQSRGSGPFSAILERGTAIATGHPQTYQTAENNQHTIKLEIYQGEHSLCRDNRKLGELSVTRLPARSAGEVSVDVRFTYDLNGLLEVEATVGDTGRKFSSTFERVPGR